DDGTGRFSAAEERCESELLIDGCSGGGGCLSPPATIWLPCDGVFEVVAFCSAAAATAFAWLSFWVPSVVFVAPVLRAGAVNDGGEPTLLVSGGCAVTSVVGAVATCELFRSVSR